MENCVFCKIITGEIPSKKVYEDDFTIAFLDIKPSNPGHTLVIPKEHFENIYSMPAEAFARLAITSQKIAIATKQALDCDGINIIMNNEAAAGQIIFHSHIHIIPRNQTDGFTLFPQQSYPTEQEAEEMQELIKNELN